MENLAFRKRVASFGGRCHDVLDDFGDDCNGAVDKQTVGVAEEMKPPARLRALLATR